MLKRLDESRTAIAEHLAEGCAKDQETYWRLVGKYEALGSIRNDVKDIEQRYVDD
tara:strand:+ start:2225 stop:2389 length:165 start_codon:yes stop_codon:yes gene_type:complete